WTSRLPRPRSATLIVRRDDVHRVSASSRFPETVDESDRDRAHRVVRKSEALVLDAQAEPVDRESYADTQNDITAGIACDADEGSGLKRPADRSLGAPASEPPAHD